jgi:hypothetical protein
MKLTSEQIKKLDGIRFKRASKVKKKGPLTADQNNLMLPTKMPVDETTDNRSPPNHENRITMPNAAGSGRYPLAPALKSNGDKMLLFHIKKFRSIYLQGASGQPKGNGIKESLVRWQALRQALGGPPSNVNILRKTEGPVFMP